MYTQSVNQVLKVLTPGLTACLATVTAAQRSLSSLGYRVESQELPARPGDRPKLLLKSGNAELTRRMRTVRRMPMGEQQLVMGEYMDVEIAWLESRTVSA